MHEKGRKVWLENGILYNLYDDKLDLAEAIDRASKTLEILDKGKVDTAPIIIVISKGISSKSKLKLSDFSEIFHIGVVSKLSGVWVVGAEGMMMDLFKKISKVFFSDKVRFVESVEVAEKEVKESGLLG